MARTPHPAFEVFNEALAHAMPGASPVMVLEVATMRVSSRHLKKLQLHLDEGGRLYEDHPVIGPWLESLPDDILIATDGYRRRHGLIRVEMRHCHPEARGTARVGFVAVAHVGTSAVLVVMVADSASEENIETRNGEANGWAELVVAAWTWAAVARRLRFQRDDRMNRSNAVFVRIHDAVRSRAGGRYLWGDREIDPHQQGFEAICTANRSSEESESGKVRRLSGRLRKLQRGAWPLGLVPVGLRRPVTHDARGKVVPDDESPLEADPDQGPMLEAVLRSYANGVPKTTIAVIHALEAARDGKGTLLLVPLMPLLKETLRAKAAALLDDWVDQGVITDVEAGWVREAITVPSTHLRRVKARMSAYQFVDRIVRAAPTLRTGVHRCVQVASIPGRADYNGWHPSFIVDMAAAVPEDSECSFVVESELPFDHPYWTLSKKRRKRIRKYGFWEFRIPCGSPVALEDSVWRQIDERAERGRNQRRTAAGRSRPLAGLVFESEGATWRVGQGGDVATYRFEQQDPPANEVGRYHTIAAAHANAQLGNVLLSLAERVETAALPLVPTARESTDTPHEAQAELDRLRSELSAIDERLVGYARQLATHEPGTRRYQATEAAQKEDEQRADELERDLIPAAELAAEAHRTTPQALIEDEEEVVDADFSHLVTAGLGLLRADPYGPPELADAVTWLTDSGRGFHDLRVGEDPRQILVDVRVRVPLADGSVEWMEAGTMDLTDRKLASDRLGQYIGDAARRLLFEGESVDALAERYHWSRGDVLTRVASWLAKHSSLNQYLRHAVVTAAAARGNICAPAVVYASVTFDHEALGALRQEHGDWIVDRVREAYLADEASWSHASAWLRAPVASWRSAMASIATHGPARYGSLIASVEGLTNTEQLRDSLLPGRRAHWQPPLNVVDGWVTAAVCTRAECPGGGQAKITGFLPVPELLVRAEARFCVYCWCPEGSDHPLPPAYRRLWDVTTPSPKLQRADGIPICAPGVAVPPLAVSPLRAKEVAAAHGIPTYRVQDAARAGAIPSFRSPGGKLLFDPQAASALGARALIAQSPTEQDLSQLRTVQGVGASVAAGHLGCTLEFLSWMKRQGIVKNHGQPGAPLYLRDELDDLLATVRAQMGRKDATFRDIVSKARLARTWDVSPHTVRHMIREGTLKGVALGNTDMVAVSSVQALDPRLVAALDPTVRLSCAQVADLAGLSVASVWTNVDSGALRAVQFYRRGRFYFLPEDVDQWLAERARTRGNAHEKQAKPKAA